MIRYLAALRPTVAKDGNSASSRKSRLDIDHHDQAHLRFGTGIEDAPLNPPTAHDDVIIESLTDEGEVMADLTHDYDANTGLLTVNINGSHPIFELTA